MDKKISITADTSQIRKELTKMGQDLGKVTKPQKIKFEIDDRKFKDAIKHHQDTFKNIQSDIKKTIVQMTGASSDKAYGSLNSRLEASRKDLSIQAQRLRDLGVRPGGAEGGGGGGGGALAGLASRISPYAIAAYAGYKVLGGLSSGVSAAQSTMGSYSRLRGMGYGLNQASPMIQESARRGLGPDESRGLMGQLLQGTGTMDPNLYRQIQTMSRGYGVDAGMLGGIAGSIRQTGTQGLDVIRKNAEIMASALSSKLERGRIGEYLQITASTIERMQSGTAGLNTTPIAQMMAMLSNKGSMTPSMAAGNIGAMDSLIKGPSGSQSPLVFNALAQTLAQGGYKGSIPLAIQTLQTTGLSKPNLTEQNFPALAASGQLKGFQDIYGAFDPMAFMKNMGKGIQQTSGKMGPAFAANIGAKYGLQGGAAGVGEFLATVNSPGFNKDQANKMLETFMPKAEIQLKDVNQSLEGISTTLETTSKAQLELVGDKLLPVVTDMKGYVVKFVDAVMPLIGPAGKVAGGIGSAAKWLPGVSMVMDGTPYPGAPTWSEQWGASKKKLQDWGIMNKDPAAAGAAAGAAGGAASSGGGGGWSMFNAAMGLLGGGTAHASTGAGGGVNNPNISYKNASIKKLLGQYINTAPNIYNALADSPMSMQITESQRAQNAGYGAKNSLHKVARAVDIGINGMSAQEVKDRLDYLNSKPGVKAEYHAKGTAPHIHAYDKVYMPHELTSAQY